MTDTLVHSALRAITSVDFVSQDELNRQKDEKNNDAVPRSFNGINFNPQTLLMRGPVPTEVRDASLQKTDKDVFYDKKKACDEVDAISIANPRALTTILEQLGRKYILLSGLNREDTIRDVRKMMHRKGEIHLGRLLYAGQVLEDCRRMSDYNIVNGSVIHCVLDLRGGSEDPIKYIDENLRDPRFDYDFGKLNDDGLTFMRGPCEYKRPIGWTRHAFKVIDRFGDNVWLGLGVSYHGTNKDNVGSIAENGFLLCRGQRFLFGRGIYSTPDINVAERYATEFEHDGDTYKVVLQNRVNPAAVKVVPDSVTGAGEYWIVQDEYDIHAYGLLIKKCPRNHTNNGDSACTIF
ncbi:uncharacterized protein LOC118438812 isoform X2 [Folsomia candida]|uniref:uncharacterized protein LOC118438812 isoform X2 n=1 Tax=Folsomia candida TaxID=158441 RepID=UPI001604AF83|nr:uncharacterized protein LOC118438812 isoform X2 [Folsomia candida]